VAHLTLNVPSFFFGRPHGNSSLINTIVKNQSINFEIQSIDSSENRQIGKLIFENSWLNLVSKQVFEKY